MPAVAWLGKREVAAIALLLLVFIAIRLPGLSLPYHQDEWKNAEMVRTHLVGGLSAHPPLMELIYRWSGEIAGADNLRLMPLAFGVLSAWLLYAVSAYAVLASLMLDMDGTILPTFFLAAVYAYDRFRSATSLRGSYVWLSVLAFALIVGFLTKLSFVLVL